MNKAWKQFERDIAQLIGGRRYWANSGAAIDCESDEWVVQCKLVKTLSLSALTQLAIIARQQGEARGKAGLVAVKLRNGRGRQTPALIVMIADAFSEKFGGASSWNARSAGIPEAKSSTPRDTMP